MDKKERIAKATEAVAKGVLDQPCDFFVVIAADYEKSEIRHFLHFEGHPPGWSPDDVNEAAQMMCNVAVSSMKTNKTVVEGIKPKHNRKILFGAGRHHHGIVGLFTTWVYWPEAWRPFVFTIELTATEFGLCYSYYEGDKDGKSYWGAYITIGMLRLRLSRNKP